MEHQKILGSLNKANDSKFATRKWNIVNDLSNAKGDLKNESTGNTEVLKYNICDYNNAYSNAYILIKGNITVTESLKTQVSFENCASFMKYPNISQRLME